MIYAQVQASAAVPEHGVAGIPDGHVDADAAAVGLLVWTAVGERSLLGASDPKPAGRARVGVLPVDQRVVRDRHLLHWQKNRANAMHFHCFLTPAKNLFGLRSLTPPCIFTANALQMRCICRTFLQVWKIP